MQSAWNLYGEENFEFSILEKVEDLNSLKYIEQKYINELQPFDSRGYNLCKNTNSYSFGYKRSEEYKEKMRKPHSEKHIKHLRECHPRSKDVIMFDLLGNELYRFPSASETVRKLKEIYNIKALRSLISGCCRGKYYKVYGFIFLYVEDYENNKELLDLHVNHTKKKTSTSVVRISYDFNEIKIYDSITEAKNIIGVKDGGTISACCTHNIKTAHGYFWLYHDEYLEHRTNIKQYIMAFQNKNRCLLKDKIIQLNNDYSIIKKWDSYEDIHDELGITYVALSSCLCGKSESCGGFRWLRESDYNSGEYIRYTSKIIKQNRKVVQCDLNDTFIKEWKNPNAVTREFPELKSHSIRNYCSHKHETNIYKGYKWYFSEEYYLKIK